MRRRRAFVGRLALAGALALLGVGTAHAGLGSTLAAAAVAAACAGVRADRDRTAPPLLAGRPSCDSKDGCRSRDSSPRSSRARDRRGQLDRRRNPRPRDGVHDVSHVAGRLPDPPGAVSRRRAAEGRAAPVAPVVVAAAAPPPPPPPREPEEAPRSACSVCCSRRVASSDFIAEDLSPYPTIRSAPRRAGSTKAAGRSSASTSTSSPCCGRTKATA